jgi:hypothetical protein
MPITRTNNGSDSDWETNRAFPHTKVHRMLTAEQYRARAVEYAHLHDNARSDTEARMFRELKQSYLVLAENMEWLAANRGKTIQSGAESPATQPRKVRRIDFRIPPDRDQILQRLGAAVILRWNTIPTKLQRELFDDASNSETLDHIAPLKQALARFLHDHKDDAQLASGGG